MDFWISKWISGFQSGFLDFVGFLDFQIGFLPTVYEISFVADPSQQAVFPSPRKRRVFEANLLDDGRCRVSPHFDCRVEIVEVLMIKGSILW